MLLFNADFLLFLSIYHFKRELSTGNSSESELSKLEMLKNTHPAYQSKDMAQWKAE